MLLGVRVTLLPCEICGVTRYFLGISAFWGTLTLKNWGLIFLLRGPAVVFIVVIEVEAEKIRAGFRATKRGCLFSLSLSHWATKGSENF
jgi:hypothetical protein